jgi:hypothetical protein
LRLRHEHGLDLDARSPSEIGRREDVMAAGSPHRDDSPIPAGYGVAENPLELSDLVSAVYRMSQIVPLDPELALSLRERREVLYRRGVAPEVDAGREAPTPPFRRRRLARDF